MKETYEWIDQRKKEDSKVLGRSELFFASSESHKRSRNPSRFMEPEHVLLSHKVSNTIPIPIEMYPAHNLSSIFL
jgi:hypothetical protein